MFQDPLSDSYIQSRYLLQKLLEVNIQRLCFDLSDSYDLQASQDSKIIILVRNCCNQQAWLYTFVDLKIEQSFLKAILIFKQKTNDIILLDMECKQLKLCRFIEDLFQWECVQILSNNGIGYHSTMISKNDKYIMLSDYQNIICLKNSNNIGWVQMQSIKGYCQFIDEIERRIYSASINITQQEFIQPNYVHIRNIFIDFMALNILPLFQWSVKLSDIFKY